MDEEEFVTPSSFDGLLANREKFLRFLSSRVADRGAAEDILQSAYMKALESGSDLRSTESAVAWFYRILRNSVVDHYRRSAARSAALDRLAPELPVSYEVELEERACACVAEVVRELKPEYRQAIESVDLREEQVERLALKAGITVNNATLRLHRARKALAGRLITICGACADHKCTDCTCRRG